MATRQGPPRPTPPPYQEPRGSMLPNSLEAERAILGAIILHSEAFDAVADVVGPTDFWRRSHQTLFAAMARLSEQGTVIDLVTLKEELARHGDLDDVGGPVYISALVDGLPRAINVASYGAIVAEKARLRAAIATAEKLSKAAYAAEQEAVDLTSAAAEELYALGGPGLRGEAVLLSELISPGMEQLEAASAAKTGSVTGLTTGYTALDDLTTGLQPSDLVLVAARTSQGKTALAMGIARAAGAVRPVLVFSLEMSRSQLFMRLLASEARVDSHRLRSAYLQPDDWSRVAVAIQALSELRILIDDSPALGVREVRARARQVKAKHGLGAIVVDYIQLMRGRGQFDNRTQEIGTISRGLKAVARELEVPVVALAQLSRASEAAPGRKARRPQLSDLAESGSLENDADVVLMIYRPEPKDGEEDNVAEIIVAKQRNGPTGVVRLAWRKEYVRFENLSL